MAEAQLLVTAGVDPALHARLRDELGRFMTANERGRMYTETQLGLAVSRFTTAVRQEFMRHNRTGESLRTIRIEVLGLRATLSMGRGAPFVYYGWSRAAQVAPQGHAFSFIDQDGERVFTKRIKAAHFIGDKFLDRAMRKVDLTDMLLRIAHGVYADIVGYATDRRGFQYTGGQQLRPSSAVGFARMIR